MCFEKRKKKKNTFATWVTEQKTNINEGVGGVKTHAY